MGTPHPMKPSSQCSIVRKICSLTKRFSSFSPSAPVEIAEPTDSASIGTITNDDPNPFVTEKTVIGDRFYPMSVGSVAIRRESQNTRSLSENDYRIEAMLYQYPKTSDVPQGWTACRHPDGVLYFMHDESKTFTEVNICDPDVYADIEFFRTFLFSELEMEIKNHNLCDALKVDEVELVVEPRLDGLGVMCCYYFVNPQTRSVFWLDEWNAYEVFQDSKGLLSALRKEMVIEAQYWYTTYPDNLNHWGLYPNPRKVTQELKDEVVDMILHATCDQLTLKKSTFTLAPGLEELKDYLAIVDRIDPENTGKYGHCAVVIGQIMHTLYASRTRFQSPLLAFADHT